jgi:hypothetical protein
MAELQLQNWMYNLIYKLMFISRIVTNQVCIDFLIWISLLVSLRIDVAWTFNIYEFLNTGFFNLPVLISLHVYFFWKALKFLILKYMKHWLTS